MGGVNTPSVNPHLPTAACLSAGVPSTAASLVPPAGTARQHFRCQKPSTGPVLNRPPADFYTQQAGCGRGGLGMGGGGGAGGWRRGEGGGQTKSSKY